jgi:hypothetical protein
MAKNTEVHITAKEILRISTGLVEMVEIVLGALVADCFVEENVNIRQTKK